MAAAGTGGQERADGEDGHDGAGAWCEIRAPPQVAPHPFWVGDALTPETYRPEYGNVGPTPPRAGQAQGEKPSPLPRAGGSSRTSPAQRIVQAVLTLLLLFLIFGVVLPQIVELPRRVGRHHRSTTLGAALLLAALLVVIEVLKGAEQAVVIEPAS